MHKNVFNVPVSRYFDVMLDILYEMAKVMIKPLDPDFRSTPQEILSDSRYLPHFKDCIRAIDCVHVQASISPCDQVPYISRKGIPTQNVMAICNFDMQYTFACAWWEDSAHDSKVFLSALRDPQSNFPKPPNGASLSALLGYAQRDRDFDESEDYSSEEIDEEMDVNAHKEDGSGRREMENLRNLIAQSLMSAHT
ncbi:hypothetical protein EZV62_018450 [Acer yangbiense]|uniref:DDE Tnp4 domain-containing protein n=1 Tax=Acer yangbiense TaxID=1000413 RepID=A0A5C7HJE7_9ROSI|nr:hypothetical protein EZV62_018450 [Acer yangbiense]